MGMRRFPRERGESPQTSPCGASPCLLFPQESPRFHPPFSHIKVSKLFNIRGFGEGEERSFNTVKLLCFRENT